jgi:hypothetical protein
MFNFKKEKNCDSASNPIAQNEIFINFRVTNCDYKLSFLLHFFTTMAKETLQSLFFSSCLVDAEIVLFVESRRVTCVANDERCSIKVHAALIATNEQV